MALYSFNLSLISRGKGQSVVAAAAYICGEKLRDDYEGKTHDRSYRRDVVYKKLLLPAGAPNEFKDRQSFMDALNTAERRQDAQMARSLKLALPNEFSLNTQIRIAQEFLEENFVSRGYPVDMAIHAGRLDLDKKPDSLPSLGPLQDNPHLHALIPFRKVDEHGFQKTKLASRTRNPRAQLKEWRKHWADTLNRELERQRLDTRVSHESLAAQGILRAPTIHLGAATIALEAKNIRTDRGDLFRKIVSRNRSREQAREQTKNRVLSRGRTRNRE